MISEKISYKPHILVYVDAGTATTAATLAFTTATTAIGTWRVSFSLARE